MAPEQIRGAKVDRRADQYAIGCILYKMLTGRAVFDGKTSVDLLAQHRSRHRCRCARPPGVEISEALEQLVMRLLEKNNQALSQPGRGRGGAAGRAAGAKRRPQPGDPQGARTAPQLGPDASASPAAEARAAPGRPLWRGLRALLLLVAGAWLLLHRRSPALPSEESAAADA